MRRSCGAEAALSHTFDEVVSAVTLNAQNFGAKGDGAANDTAALQSALAAAGSFAKSATLFVPPGEYRFTMLDVPSGVTVAGVRGATILKPITNGTTQISRLRVLNAHDVTLRDFTIDETNPTVRTGVYGQISFDNVQRVRVDNVEVIGSSGAGMHAMMATDLVITGCVVHGTLADGIHIQRGSKNVTVAYNHVFDVQDDAIGFVSHAQATAGYCENIVIVGNTLGPSDPDGTGHIGSGIALIGAIGATVVGNTIRGTGSAGIRITSIDEGASGFALAGNILITGNRLYDVGKYTGGIAQQKEGIAIYNARNVNVVANSSTRRWHLASRSRRRV